MPWAGASSPGPAARGAPAALIRTVSMLDISSILFPSDTSTSPTTTTTLTSAPTSSSSSSAASSLPGSAGAAGPSTLLTTTSSSPSPSSFSTPSATPSLPPDAATVATDAPIDHRTFTITIAVCATAFALILLFIAFLFLRRYRRGTSLLARCTGRGATPIDDDEIATWRGNSQAMGTAPSAHVRNVSSIVFQPTEGWAWTTPSTPATPPPGLREGVIPSPPPVVARAPNARSGLTDEAKPGADAYVGPARKQSKRLSKAQSTSHMRSKSRRSSVSISSMRERPSTSTSPWTEPDEWSAEQSSSPAMKTPMGRPSLGDEMRPGGLSPRPATATNIQILGSAL